MIRSATRRCADRRLALRADRGSSIVNRSHTLLSLALLWTAALALGLWILQTYGNDHPDELLNVPSAWPPGIALERDPGRLTLLLVVHPDCDCTRQALASLRDIVGRSINRLAIRIVFTDVRVTPRELHQSETWLDAHDISGADVSVDHDGHAVRNFGFRKSGHALLYDRQGRLLFSGGITSPAAPHANATAGTDNPGAHAIVLFVLAGGASTTHAPVPGCALDATAD